MARTEHRRAGRPRQTVLNRERIAGAALAVVDDRGDFTLPEVARRLGVQTASLYHHVDGRAGVVELLRERIGELMDTAPLDGSSWDLALSGYFRSYRAVFAAHPRVVPLLTTSTVTEPRVIAAYERVVVLLEEAGVQRRDVMTIVTAMENFIIGSALDLAAPDVMWEVPEGVDAPRLAAALTAQPAGDGRADRAFEFGMQTFLAMIRRLSEPGDASKEAQHRS
jgi:AcrR family transcriptional regulator